MKTSIIIVSYNTKTLTLECLASIYKHEEPESFEIILIDNASTDGSVDSIKKDFPHVKIIQNSRNVGFARANNQGIRESTAEYIFLLNSDTQLIEPMTVKKLVHTSRIHENAVEVPRLLNNDGTDQASLFKLPTITRSIQEYWLGQKHTFSKYDQRNSGFVEAAVMAAMLIPRSTLDRVGLLDEGYFMYFEDLEFCRRLKKNGIPLYFSSDIKIAHHHGASGTKVAPAPDQWKRLIPGSKRYHGLLRHTIISAILWVASKRDRLIKP